MSQYANAQIPKPTDEQVFERACTELFKCALNDPYVKTNSSRGKKQYGVDISGLRDGDPKCIVGIQCKLKGQGKKLQEKKDVREEVLKAREFEPALSEYIIVTTADDEAEHEKWSYKLTKEETDYRGFPVRVSILGWNSLSREIQKYDEAIKAFDASHTPQADALMQKLEEVNENVLRQNKPSVSHEKETQSPASIDDGADRLTTALDREITNCAKHIAKAPKTALELFEDLRERLDASTTPRIRYRVAANIAACHLELGKEELAANQLIASYDIDPSHEKAASNKALGLLLLDRKREVRALASSELAKNSENAALACYYLQACTGAEGEEDPFLLISEAVLDQPEVFVARIRYSMETDSAETWWNLASAAYEKHPDSTPIQEHYAAAILEQVIEETGLRYGYILSEEQKANLERAAAILEGSWKKFLDPSTHTQISGLSAAMNLIVAYRLLGDSAKALEVGEQARTHFPEDDVVKERLAAAYMEAGENERAKELAREIPISPVTFLVRYTAAMETRDWETITLLENEHMDDCPPAERDVVEAGILVKRASESDFDTAEKLLTDAFDKFEKNPRASVALSQFARFEGHGDLSAKYFDAAQQGIDDTASLAERMMLAHEAINREKWSLAADLIDGRIETDRLSSDLLLLAEIHANEFPARERGQRFFENLPKSVNSDPRIEFYKGVRFLNTGDSKAGAKALAGSFETERKLRTLFYLIQAYLRLNDRKSVRKLLDLDGIDDLSGHPEHKIVYCQVLEDFGEWDRAISLAYQTVCAARENPIVAMKYCGLVLKPHDGPVAGTNRVADGAWVKLASDQGDCYERLVGEGADRPWGVAVSSDNEFVKRAWGLKVGDEFEIEYSFGEKKTWTVQEIKPSWLHAFHVLSASFQERYPGQHGFATFKMNDGDIQPTLDQVKRTSEAIEAHTELYTVNEIPASLVGKDRIGRAIALSEYLPTIGKHLVTCIGTAEERQAAFEAIEANDRAGATIDALTAWRAAEMEIFPALTAVLGPLRIPAPELATLQEIVQEASIDHPGDSLTMTYKDGQFFRQVFTQHERRELYEIYWKRLELVKSSCSVQHFVLPDTLSEAGNILVEGDIAQHLSPALMPDVSGLLLSEDLYLRRMAAGVSQRQGIWLQPALMIARDRAEIDHSVYVDKVVRLAALRHHSVSISSKDLSDVFFSDDENRFLKLEILCRFVGGPNAEPISHLSLVAEFIHEIWEQSNGPTLEALRASSIVFRALIAYRCQDNWALWAASLMIMLPDDARAYFLDWANGHFLDIAQIKTALRDSRDNRA